MAAPVAAAAGTAAKSSVMSNLANSFVASAGSQLGSGIGGVLGYGIGEIFGHNRRARRQQLEQQAKLNQLSLDFNKKQMNYAQELEKQMYDYTYDKNKPETLKNLYKEAGLNPALMYGTSAGGVSGTSVGTGRGGGFDSQAADEQGIIESNIALQQMGLQLAKLQSEIDVNRSVAEKNRSSASLDTAKTTTENEQRDAFISNLYYEGKLKWFESLIHEIKFNTPADSKDNEIKARIIHDDLIIYGGVAIPNNIAQSLFGREVIAAVEASEALKDNHLATAALANEKTKYYFQELMAAIAEKDSQAALNIAKKLESEAAKQQIEWNIGEYVNWKTYFDAGIDSVNAIIELIGGLWGKGALNAIPKPNKIKGFGK